MPPPSSRGHSLRAGPGAPQPPSRARARCRRVEGGARTAGARAVGHALPPPPLPSRASGPQRAAPEGARPGAEGRRGRGRVCGAGQGDAVAEEDPHGALEARRGAGQVREEGDEPAAPQ